MRNRGDSKENKSKSSRFFLYAIVFFFLGAAFLAFSWKGSMVSNAALVLSRSFKDALGTNSGQEYLNVPLDDSATNGIALLTSSSAGIEIKEKMSLTVTSTTKVSRIVNTASPPLCNFETSMKPSHEFIFNEIAWMGTVPIAGETKSQANSKEWIELKNISDKNFSLAGWQIIDSNKKIKIIISDSKKVSTGDFYILERQNDNALTSITADKIFSGSLSNNGMWLKLFNERCEVVDETNSLSGWPGGDNNSKATLERNKNNFEWHTSAVPGGTPKKENSDT